jgi:hypothetical protein
MPDKKPLRMFSETHIKGTKEKVFVTEEKLRLITLTNLVFEKLGTSDSTPGVYVTTRALKHLYDKKPAEEYDTLLDGLDEVVKYPHQIYQNMRSKRGNLCLVGIYADAEYICPIEATPELQIVTAFRKRDEKYLRKYKLLWSREVGNPPS